MILGFSSRNVFSLLFWLNFEGQDLATRSCLFIRPNKVSSFQISLLHKQILPQESVFRSHNFEFRHFIISSYLNMSDDLRKKQLNTHFYYLSNLEISCGFIFCFVCLHSGKKMFLCECQSVPMRSVFCVISPKQKETDFSHMMMSCPGKLQVNRILGNPNANYEQILILKNQLNYQQTSSIFIGFSALCVILTDTSGNK